MNSGIPLWSRVGMHIGDRRRNYDKHNAEVKQGSSSTYIFARRHGVPSSMIHDLHVGTAAQVLQLILPS